ncbi:hypothetical protein CTEN210_07593 [Chaetoceros tenuissimus]|uniref:OBG-type G domain-containing protein n=1 Tax=Chaetoceros tenuissimus TaxID=426638 RepID=A0AAD3CRZ8_9STRA|nr:hypothetical protein CTEN210_07593 [Chaetoceros tenuissimus]
MKVKVAICGLPNVGKSTLFNAIAQRSIANSQNFPFCTIEPNVTPIPIPDPNLEPLAKIASSKKAVPGTISLVDVAGLVKGASRGEGLGNKFLATVRECDVIVHVVRSYIDDDIIHVDGKVDPVADAEVINLELLLADLAHVQRRLEKNSCPDDEREVLSKIEAALEEGKLARSIGLTETETFLIKSMGLLSLKPVIYAFNVDDIDYFLNRDEVLDKVKDYMNQIQYCDLEIDSYMLTSAKFESELGLLDAEERSEYVASFIGEDDSNVLEQLSYHILPLLVKDILNLSLVYTGPGVPVERSQTIKTHVISSGISALGLAGKLHGEIQRGFMRAEVTEAKDMLMYNNYNEARDAGNVRTEGKDYVLQNNDIILIKWK